jgi:taurine dioxygenase
MTVAHIEPLDAACGAVVTDVDLSQALDPATVQELRQAWLDHLVLILPDQHLDPDALERAALLFGPFGVDPFLGPMDGHPHIAEVKRLADETSPVFAEAWHSDWSFLETPPAGTMLYSVTVPPVGGDTLFANQYAAWDGLAEDLRDRAEQLEGIHSAGHIYAPDGFYGEKDARRRSMSIVPSDEARGSRSHPLAAVHGETGRTALFCSPAYVIGIDGLSHDDGRRLQAQLVADATRPEHVLRHRWEPNTVVLWDNRCVLHSATGGYDGHDRVLQRITIDRPPAG